MNISAEFVGFGQVAHIIESRVEAPVKTGLLDALMQGGKIFTEGCQENAPVKTGWLRDHIHEDAVGDDEVVVQPHDTPYAIYQEVGTYKMPAHPFMRPGYNTKKAEAIAAMGTMLAKLIK